MVDYLPMFLRGLQVTVQLSILSIIGCAVFSVVVGALQFSAGFAGRLALNVIVEALRAASVIVYLFWVYYSLPLVPGFPQLNPIVASVVVFSLCGGAYGAEIVRSGLEAVPPGQWQASHALGLSPFRTFTKVILPQALTPIVPAFGSLAVDMVKWTSLASFVGVPDILYVANSIRSLTFDSISVYIFIAVVYFILCTLFSLAFRLIERKLPITRALKAVHAAQTGHHRQVGQHQEAR